MKQIQNKTKILFNSISVTFNLLFLEQTITNFTFHLLDLVFSIPQEFRLFMPLLILCPLLTHFGQFLVVLLSECIHLLLRNLLSLHNTNHSYLHLNTHCQSFHQWTLHPNWWRFGCWYAPTVVHHLLAAF